MAQPRQTPYRILAQPRPYVMTFHSSGHSYPLSSDECQRLLDGYPAVVATRGKVVLQGDGDRTTLRPATLGGGPAFELERMAE